MCVRIPLIIVLKYENIIHVNSTVEEMWPTQGRGAYYIDLEPRYRLLQ
jgi:hypothetical protein